MNFNIDRTQFINYQKGLLYLKVNNEERVVVNRSLCQQAESLLKQGEKIIFTSRDEPITIAHLEDNKVVEE